MHQLGMSKLMSPDGILDFGAFTDKGQLLVYSIHVSNKCSVHDHLISKVYENLAPPNPH